MRIRFAGTCLLFTAAPAAWASAPPAPAPSFELARKAFLDATQALAPKISDSRHLPRILDHGHPTPYVAVITHGLYDSPFAQMALAQDLFDRGMNVVMPLLPGHWNKESREIDEAPYLHYLRVQDEAVATAKLMGERLVLIGHSTGALLAYRTSLHEQNVAALVLAAPAFGLTRRSEWLSRIGNFLHLSGNWFGFGRPDGLTVPYLSPFAGLQVAKLIEVLRNEEGFPRTAENASQEEARFRALFHRNRFPLVMVLSSQDRTIRNDLADLFVAETQGPSLNLTTTILGHADCGRFLADRPNGPVALEKWNESQRLEKATARFLAKELKLPEHL